jgi:hypothetical protein
VKPSDVKRAVKALYPTRRPLALWGPPGVGKSQVVRQAAGELGLSYLDVRLVYHEPGDLKFPVVDQKARTVEWVNTLFPDDPDWRGIIALEELPQAAPAVQAAAMQLTLDRKVGSYSLPDGAMVVACGNRQEDQAGARRLITPLLNRLIHLDLEVSVPDWTAWASAENVHPAVVSLIQYKPALLHDFRPERNEREFPTPRSWCFASDVLGVAPPELRLALLSGCVGKGAAAELEGWLEVREGVERKYPLDRIIDSPDSAPVPTLGEGAILWALAGLMGERSRGKDKAAVHACMRYAVRLPLEFAVYAVREVVRQGGAVNALSAPGASAFIDRNRHVLYAA